MGAVRIALAAIALVAAVFLALLASDLRSWDDGIRNGDARFVQSPAAATWTATTFFPFGITDRVLGIDDQIDFRHAAKDFGPVHLLGCGFDNCYSESRPAPISRRR
jgi:hypothetical protein